ncbi:MAG TPA: MFS transporter [Steroidobacteraceae bacterium]|jgi:MFS family permease|nr:MFS transporter [Steroidobacteraceae bacterium]
MWLQSTSASERRVLLATYAGYGLDGFDLMIYSFIIPTLLTLWSMSKAQAGYIATGALVTSAIGGWAAGVLADRFGRARILQLTVLWFALFTFLSGFTHNFGELFLTRALQGFGFGGEWSVGSVLVAEIIDARHRGKATGLVQSSWSVGWAAAALAYWAVSVIAPPEVAWKILFWLGILPGLLVIYIRRNVAEPAIFTQMRAQRVRAAGVAATAGSPARRGVFLDIFRPPLLRTTILATLLSTGMLGAYYSITTWLPTFLAKERHLSVGASTGYLLMVISGSLAGYLVSAWLTDAIGRRRGFILFAACAMVLILLYTRLPVAGGMFLIGFPLGFFILGIFSGMGACLAELYPSAVRGSGQGFTYSVGRGIGGFCPSLIGVLSTRFPLGDTIAGFTVAAYALVIVSALAIPETRGRVLESAVES